MKKLLALALLGLATGAFADEAGAAKAFARATRTEPELIAFLKGMPKGGDLHNHVSGAIYSDFMLDAAVKAGLYFDLESGTFQTKETKYPAAQVLQNNDLLYKFLNIVSMRGWMGGGQSGHDHFFATFGKFGTALDAMTEADVLAEVLARSKAQNLQYMELMVGTTPWEARSAFFADLPKTTDLRSAFEKLRPRCDALLQASQKFLDERDAEVTRKLRLPVSVTSPESPITARYIWSCNRLSNEDTFFAQVVAGLYLASKEPRVVALNIVAPEDHPNARVNFERQMEMIDFVWKEFGRPNITLHAGELTLPISPWESMRDRIRKTIDRGHARRIGHGVSIAWEDNLPDLLARMKREGIAVEICLTSNMGILGVEGDRHPLRLYREAGVPVFLNTDDEGVSRSNMTNEWVRAVRDQKVGYLDLKEMARNSIEYSFLPGESLYVGRDFRRLRPEFRDVRRADFRVPPALRTRLNASPKMQVQLRLERAFIDFEARF
ncbi:MAG: adenosine deaminase family protein [Fimbriimonas sp.]